MISLKSEEGLKTLREAGVILAGIMRQLQKHAKEGIATEDLDKIAQELMQEAGVVSAFKDYRGFPAHICTSINDEVVHGIPGKRVLEGGDILSIDAGIKYKGYFSDTAITVAVGEIGSKQKKLIEVARRSLFEGIKKAKVNNRLTDISYAIQNYVEKNGFSVVRDFVGHGIGTSLHEAPEIPNFGRPHQGPVLKSGMVFAVEPMVNMGSWEVIMLDNNWTAATKDGLASAHFEHTIVITDNGPVILTN